MCITGRAIRGIQAIYVDKVFPTLSLWKTGVEIHMIRVGYFINNEQELYKLSTNQRSLLLLLQVFN